MSEPIDLDTERNKRLPQTSYVDLTFDKPAEWLQQVFENGKQVPGVTGLNFGLEPMPGVIINAEQCRELATALLQVADHLDEEKL